MKSPLCHALLSPAAAGLDAAAPAAARAGKPRPDAARRARDARGDGKSGRVEKAGPAGPDFAAVLARLVPHAPAMPPPGVPAAPTTSRGAKRADADPRAQPDAARQARAPAKPEPQARPHADGPEPERAHHPPGATDLVGTPSGAGPAAAAQDCVDASFLRALRDAQPAAAAVPTPPEPAVAVALMPRAAHLACDLEGAGELKLHLRIQDGVAQIRASGEAVPLVANHADELRAALAAAGLQLGNLDLGGDGDGAQRPAAEDLPDRAPATPRGTPRPTGDDSPAPAAPGRLHLKA